MGVGDQERDVVSLANQLDCRSNSRGLATHRDRLSPQYNEALRSLHHKPRELVTKYALNLVRLLDPDAHADRVDRRFNENTFVLITGYRQWV